MNRNSNLGNPSSTRDAVEKQMTQKNKDKQKETHKENQKWKNEVSFVSLPSGLYLTLSNNERKQHQAKELNATDNQTESNLTKLSQHNTNNHKMTQNKSKQIKIKINQNKSKQIKCVQNKPKQTKTTKTKPNQITSNPPNSNETNHKNNHNNNNKQYKKRIRKQQKTLQQYIYKLATKSTCDLGSKKKSQTCPTTANRYSALNRESGENFFQLTPFRMSSLQRRTSDDLSESTLTSRRTSTSDGKGAEPERKKKKKKIVYVTESEPEDDEDEPIIIKKSKSKRIPRIEKCDSPVQATGFNPDEEVTPIYGDDDEKSMVDRQAYWTFPPYYAFWSRGPFRLNQFESNCFELKQMLSKSTFAKRGKERWEHLGDAFNPLKRIAAVHDLLRNDSFEFKIPSFIITFLGKALQEVRGGKYYYRYARQIFNDVQTRAPDAINNGPFNNSYEPFQQQLPKPSTACIPIPTSSITIEESKNITGLPMFTWQPL